MRGGWALPLLFLFLVFDGGFSSVAAAHVSAQQRQEMSQQQFESLMQGDATAETATTYYDGYNHPICLLMYTELVMMLFSIYFTYNELWPVARVHQHVKYVDGEENHIYTHGEEKSTYTNVRVIKYILPDPTKSSIIRNTGLMTVALFIIGLTLFMNWSTYIMLVTVIIIILNISWATFNNVRSFNKLATKHGEDIKEPVDLVDDHDNQDEAKDHGHGHDDHAPVGAGKTANHIVGQYGNVLGMIIFNMTIRIVLLVIGYFKVETFCYQGSHSHDSHDSHDAHDDHHDDHGNHSNHSDHHHDHGNSSDHDDHSTPHGNSSGGHDNSSSSHNATQVLLGLVAEPQLQDAARDLALVELKAAVQGSSPLAVPLVMLKTIFLMVSLVIFGYAQAYHIVVHGLGHAKGASHAHHELAETLVKLHHGAYVEQVIVIFEAGIGLVEVLFMMTPTLFNTANVSEHTGIMLSVSVMCGFLFLMCIFGVVWTHTRMAPIVKALKGLQASHKPDDADATDADGEH